MSFARIKSALASAAGGGFCNYSGAVTLNTVANAGHNARMSSLSSASGSFLLQILQTNNAHATSTLHDSVVSGLNSLGLLKHQKDSLSFFANNFIINSTENVLATIIGYTMLGIVGAQTGTLGQVVSDAIVGTVPYSLADTAIQLMFANSSRPVQQKPAELPSQAIVMRA